MQKKEIRMILKTISSFLIVFYLLSCNSSKNLDKELLWDKYSDKILECIDDENSCCNELYPILNEINSIKDDYMANSNIAKCYCIQDQYEKAVSYARSKGQEDLAAIISYYFLADSASLPFLKQKMVGLEKSEPSPAALNDYFILYATLHKHGTYEDFLDKTPKHMVQYKGSNTTLSIIEKSFNDIDKGKWICNL